MTNQEEDYMYRKSIVTTLFVLLALVCVSANLEAQTLPPVALPPINLKAVLVDGGKVQMAWEVVTRDTVKYYFIYRAAFTTALLNSTIVPDTLKFTRIDSLTARSYVDIPPRLSSTTAYIYYVTGTTDTKTVLKSNMVVMIMFPSPIAREVVRITSWPNEAGQIGIVYQYQVKAQSSDSTATLKYFLNVKPTGMSIDSVTGLIKWTPTERGYATVEVTVKSNKGGSATQWYTIKVAGGNGAIVGTVTDTTGTKPIGQVTITLFKLDLMAPYDYREKSDASGNFKIDGVDPGTYYVRAEPSNSTYLAQWYDRAYTLKDATTIKVIDNASTVVNIKLQARYKPVTFSVKGSVIDSASHAPLKDALVDFVIAGFALNGSRGFAADPTGAEDVRGMFDRDPVSDFRLDGTNTQFVFQARTDSNGRFALQLPLGSYIAYAEAKAHIKIFYKQKTNLLTADTIAVNANMDGINFNLPPIPAVVLGEINGTISDSASGKGVRSRVIAFRELWTVMPGAPVLTPALGASVPGAYVTDTDTLGKYSIVNIVPGQYFVLAVPVGSYAPAFYSSSGSTQMWSKASRIAVSGNVVAGIDITVKPFSKPVAGYTFVSGSVNTTVAGKLGKTSASVGVMGAIVYAVSSAGGIYGYDVTDEHGSYAIAGVAPGSYTLFVDAPGYSTPSSMIASPTYGADAKGTPQPGSSVNFNVNSLTVTAVEEDQPMVPSGYVLEQNYPNPFNPTTQILFTMPSNGRVTLTVYNIIGQKIVTLVDGVMAAGSHIVTWNGKDSRGIQLPSGVYLYRLESPGFTAARKMLMLK